MPDKVVDGGGVLVRDEAVQKLLINIQGIDLFRALFRLGHEEEGGSLLPQKEKEKCSTPLTSLMKDEMIRMQNHLFRTTHLCLNREGAVPN